MGSDPTMGAVRSKYTTHDQELIKCGAIIDLTRVPSTNQEKDGPFTDTYLSDRMKLQRFGASLFKNTEAWSYYKVEKKNKNSRVGFKSVLNHYLSPNNVDHIAASAEKLLATSSYQGEKRSWNFEKFATMHMEQHNILESLVEHGYTGIDARSKVRFLNDGIKSTSLDAVKTRIMSDNILRGDFAQCVTLYKDFIKQQGLHERNSLNISQVGTGGGGKTTVVIEDRYYDREEWDKLSPSQRAEVLRIRKARASATSQKNGKRGGGSERKYTKSHVTKLEKKVKAQRLQLSAMNAQKHAGEEGGSDDEGLEASEEQSNCSNRSLLRQRKLKKRKSR